MEKRHEQAILFVAFGLLAFGFFSSSVDFGTGHITAAGDTTFTCRDYSYLLKSIANNRVDLQYDMNGDGALNHDDVFLLRQEAYKNPCDLPDECLMIGRTTCDGKHKIVTCVYDDFGKKVKMTQSCDKGMECVHKQTIHKLANVIGFKSRGSTKIEQYALCKYPLRG